MRTYELVAMSIAAGAVFVPLITWGVLWLVRRDRIFVGVAPGEVAAEPEGAPTKLVGPGTEYGGDMPLRTVPPAGISPGLAGVVLDGYADGRDIAAMVLDLSRRGWLEVAAGPEAHARDWQITRVDKPLDASLDLNEVYLITNIAVPGGTTLMSELRSRGDNRLGLVQQDLAREVVTRGWYPAPPSQPSDVPMAVLGLGGLLGIVVALVSVTPVTVCAGAVIVACAYLTSIIVRGNTPRTALGTAVRVQVLGFRAYLSQAQSHQFSYIDAAGTFGEYLPWAVVFGLERQWAETFAELDVVADAADLHLAQDLRWFAGIRGPENAVTPTPVQEVPAAPRRVAVAEPEPEPEIAPAEPVEDEPAPSTLVPVLIEAAPLAEVAPVEDQEPVERFAPPPERRGLLATVRRATSAVAGSIRPLLPAREVPETAESLPTSPMTPVRVAAEPITEVPPSVRQWVPRPSTRPEPLAVRPRPAMPDRTEAPSAPATPRRPPRIPVAQAAPVPTVATFGEQPTPVAQAPEPVRDLPVARPSKRPAAQPADDRNPWADWLDEFDLAMSGDFDAEGPDATEGGTVISGPERFDVLLALPLWPDLPADDARPDLRAG